MIFSSGPSIGSQVFRMASGDQANSGTTTNQTNITDLLIPGLIKNCIYRIEGIINIKCDGTGGNKLAWTIPTGATFNLWNFGKLDSTAAVSTTPNTVSGTLFPTALDKIAGSAGYKIDGTLTMGGTDGNAQPSFASVTNGQITTIIAEGTVLTLRRIA